MGPPIDEARRVGGLTEDVVRFDGLTARLAAVAPVWAGRIAGSAGEESVTGPVDRGGARLGVAAGRNLAPAIIDADDPAELQRQLECGAEAVTGTTAELAAQSAWLAVAERLTDTERRGLTAWLARDPPDREGHREVRRPLAQRGAEGDGRRADRRAGVDHAGPPGRGVLRPDGARFDVVIMDESSQCDIFGLAALAVADKAIIVGDDKQISPQAIGTEESAVHELISQHIRGPAAGRDCSTSRAASTTWRRCASPA